jgi:hypothetical protein
MDAGETWTFRRTEERRLEAAEVRFLLHVAGHTLRDKERGDEIRPQVEIGKLDKHILTHGAESFFRSR